MGDKQYRELTKIDVNLIDGYMYYLTHDYYNKPTQHRAWLRIVGLIETWDIIVNDNH